MNLPIETSPDKIKLKSNEKSLLKKIKKTDEWEKVKDIKDLYNEIKEYNIDKEDIGIKCAKWLNDSGKDGQLEISELYNSCYKLRPLKKKKEKETKTKEPKQPKGRKGSVGKETKEEIKKKVEDTDKIQEGTQINNEDINNAIKEAVEKSKDDNGNIDPNKFVGNMGSTANYVFGLLCANSGFKLLGTIMNALQNVSNVIDINDLGWDSTKERAWLISKKLLGKVLKTVIDCSGLALATLTKYLYDNGWDIFTGSSGVRNGERPPETNFPDEDEDDDGGGGGEGSGLPQQTGVLRRSPTGNLTWTADDIEAQRVAQQQQQQQQTPEGQQRQNLMKAYYNQLRSAVNTKLESDIKKTGAYTDKKQQAEDKKKAPVEENDLVKKVEKQNDNQFTSLGGMGGLFGLGSYMFSNNMFRNVERPPAPLGATRQAGRSEGVAPQPTEEPAQLQRERADRQRTQNLERQRQEELKRSADSKKELERQKKNEEDTLKKKKEFDKEVNRQIDNLGKGGSAGGGVFMPGSLGLGYDGIGDSKIVEGSLVIPGIPMNNPNDMVITGTTPKKETTKAKTLQYNKEEEEELQRKVKLLMEMEKRGDQKVSPEQAKAREEEQLKYDKIQQQEQDKIDKMIKDAENSIKMFQDQTDFNMDKEGDYLEQIKLMNEMYGTEPPEEMTYNADLMFESPMETPPRRPMFPLRLGQDINTELGNIQNVRLRTNTLRDLQLEMRENIINPSERVRQEALNTDKKSTRLDQLKKDMTQTLNINSLQREAEENQRAKYIEETIRELTDEIIYPNELQKQIERTNNAQQLAGEVRRERQRQADEREEQRKAIEQIASLQRLIDNSKGEPDAPEPVLPVSVPLMPSNNPVDNSLQQRSEAQQTQPLAPPGQRGRPTGSISSVWRQEFRELTGRNINDFTYNTVITALGDNTEAVDFVKNLKVNRSRKTKSKLEGQEGPDLIKFLKEQKKKKE